jgi:hypothetical protein
MLIKRTCELCSAEFEATRANARYCGPAHRNKAYRDRRQAVQSAGSEAEASGGTPGGQQAGRGVTVEDALLAELRAAQVDGTAMGRALMVVARRIDVGETGAALSSLVLRLGIELERTSAGRLPVARRSRTRSRRRGTSVTASALLVRPAFHTAPAYDFTLGPVVIDFCASVGYTRTRSSSSA